jgi:adenylate cyclase
MERPPIKIPDLLGRAPGGRRLIAVVCFDMVGYSRLIGLDDFGTLVRLKAIRDTLIDPAIEEHGGSIIQTAGDSLLVVFDSIDGAVRCMVNIQRRMPGFDGDHHADQAIRFRAGINIGDVIAHGTDLHGDGVNVAARLQAECPPGDILITRAVRDHVHDRLGLTFEALGSLSLKNIARPIEAFLLRLEPNGSNSKPQSAAEPATGIPAKQPRLLVMMTILKNQGVPRDLDYLVEGISEDLATDLSQYLGYSVVIDAPEAVPNPADIARKAGAGYVVQGSLGGTTNRLILTVHLINIATGVHLMRERFMIDLCDEEALAEISGQAAWILTMKLYEDINHHIESLPSEDWTADELILRGRALILRPWSADIRHRDDHLEAARCFDRALLEAPDSIHAKLGVAALRINSIFEGWSPPGGADEAQTEQFLTDVLRIETDVPIMRPYAHMMMGILRRIQGRWSDSYIELSLAAKLAPHHAPAIANLGFTLAFMNQPEAAIPMIERVVRLKPHDNYIPLYYAGLGFCHLLTENIEMAITSLRMARALNPSIYYSHVWLAAALGLKGELNEAVAALRVAIEMHPGLLAPSMFFLLRGTGLEFFARYERTLYRGLQLTAGHTNDIVCPDIGTLRRMVASV